MSNRFQYRRITFNYFRQNSFLSLVYRPPTIFPSASVSSFSTILKVRHVLGWHKKRKSELKKKKNGYILILFSTPFLSLSRLKLIQIFYSRHRRDSREVAEEAGDNVDGVSDRFRSLRIRDAAIPHVRSQLDEARHCASGDDHRRRSWCCTGIHGNGRRRPCPRRGLPIRIAR